MEARQTVPVVTPFGSVVAVVVGLVLIGLVGCTPNDGTPTEETSISAVSDTVGAEVQTAAAAGVQGFVLRYRAGETFRYRVVQLSESGPDTARTISKSTHWYTRTVRQVRSDGSFETSMRFDSISVSAVIKNTQTGAVLVEQSYRSSDTASADKQRYPQFSSLIGEDVLVYITPDGKVQQIGDVTPIVKKITSTSAQAVPAQALEQLASQIKTGVYAAYTLQEFVPYPKQQIDSVGSWVNEQESPLSEFFTLRTVAAYSLKKVYETKQRRLGAIEASVDGEVRVVKLPKAAPFTVTLNSSSIRGTSQSVIDVDRGFTISKKNHIAMAMKATIRIPQNPQQTVSQSQSSRYEIELLP